MSTNGNQQMCQNLLREGALLDKRDPECKTALYEAVFCGHMEICTLLLENKASIIKKKQIKVQLHFQWQPKTVMFMYVSSYLTATHMSIKNV